MRALVLALLALTAGLAGCMGDGEDPDAAPDDGTDREDRAGDPGSGRDTGSQRETGIPAPTLPVGRAWTYEATGVYDTGTTVTIVVAQATDEGYLLAGKAPGDLLEEVSWDRPWQGQVDLELNPAGEDGSTLFDFPLDQGKTWEDRGATVTARIGQIPHPDGQRIGLIMSTETEDGERVWTYDPQVGYLTSYRSTRGNTTYLQLNLTETTTSETWTWFEPHAQAFSDGSAPGMLEVPGEATGVVVSAGGWGGGQAQIVPPLTGPAPATYQFTDQERWTYDTYEAAEGSWQLTAQSPPQGLGFIQATAVTWTGPGAP